MRAARSLPLAREVVDGTALTLSAYEPRGHVPPHRHGRDQMCILLGGRYEASWGAERQHLRRGDAVLHPAGLLHEDRLLDRRCTSLRIEWEPAAELPWITLRSARRVESARIRFLAEALGEELGAGSEASSLALRGLLMALCAELRRRVHELPAEVPGWLEQARRFVADHYLDPIGLRDVSAHTRRGRTQLSAEFRRHFGTSVGELVQRLRVEHAEALMARSDRGLAEIALASGFCDQAHFSRVFRKHRGVAPGAWRRSRDDHRPNVPTAGRASKIAS